MGRLKALLASRNAHKLRELAAALPGWEIGLLPAKDYPSEDGESYVENARLKARFARAVAGPDGWVLGEDSGLEVAGLAGRPGLRSARYADPGEDPNAKLLRELQDVDGPGRRARYVCELVGISPEGKEVRGTGVLEGSIALARRGSEGFGYDPVFVPVGEERTVAELGDAWKRTSSHRARAARAFGNRVRAL